MLIAEACSWWRTEVDNYLDNAVDIAVSCVVTFCHYLLQRCARSQSLHISRSRLSDCLGRLFSFRKTSTRRIGIVCPGSNRSASLECSPGNQLS